MRTACLRSVGALLLASTWSYGADLVLFNFAREVETSQIKLADTRLLPPEPAGQTGLRVATGHNESWPGITLSSRAGQWDLGPYSTVALKLKNAGTNTVSVSCRVDNPGADGTSNCVTHSITLKPGQTETLRVPLKRTHDNTLAGKLFGMRGYPVAWGRPGTVNPSNITQLLVFVAKPKEDHLFELQEVRAAGTWTPPTAWVTDADPFFPCIDSFGQYRHKDWPGKVKSTADLKARREQENADLLENSGPKDWDKYGGWAAGPKLKATGFFHTQKLDGKWWLVDPGGRLFFSHGIDCVRMFDSTPIEERENWFADFPGNQPEFAAFRSHASVLKGHYAGRSPLCFSFVGANLLRKYGADWSDVYPQFVHKRLRSWGINTIANWSDPTTRSLRLTPYTDSISSGRSRRIDGSEGYWGKFPDVFAPGFAESVRSAMNAKRNGSAGDPWCLGYFSDNEMAWGDEVSLALAALQSPPDQAAKLAFVADLKTKYGEIEKLNQTWGTAHASWDALLQARKAPERAKAEADLGAFYTRTAEQYFRVIRDAIKAVAPDQLYLGCRFAWVNARAAAAAAKYCDVVSYNLYRTSVADFQFNGGADVPLMIGEFHFGALDRGMFHTGLVPVASQEARAQAYKEYVRSALRHPQFVGCHWFQYFDEPTTGRAFDEENYQIGFVDTADTPYAETIAASREMGYNLYASQK